MTNNLRRPPANECNFLIVPMPPYSRPYAIRIDQDICQQAYDRRATHMTNYGLCSLSAIYICTYTYILVHAIYARILDPDRSPLRPLMMHDRRRSEAPFDRLADTATASSVKYSPSKQRTNTRHRQSKLTLSSHTFRPILLSHCGSRGFLGGDRLGSCINKLQSTFIISCLN